MARHQLSAEAVVARLVQAGCVAAGEEAEELISHAHDAADLERSIRRRERGVPLAWITGGLQFCGQRILVEEGVYVPRLQSEELARRASDLLPNGGRAVELCAGAGAIAAHLRARHPGASVLAVDLDPASARCARRNGLPSVVGDLGESLRSRAFDVVVAVAPYVPTEELRFLPADVLRHEPRLALDGGDDGLDLVRRIVTGAKRLLVPGGWLLIELGADQDELLADHLAASGFGPPTSFVDGEGDLRGLCAQLEADAA